MHLLTSHFGDPLKARDGQGHHKAQAGAYHEQTVADEQAGHTQVLLPCREHRESGEALQTPMPRTAQSWGLSTGKRIKGE